MKTKRNVGGKSSACKEPLKQFSSADDDPLVKEMVISVLEHDGQLWNPINNRDRLPCSPSQPCELCGCLEDPLKMLICDHCQKTFHLYCSNPEVKKLEVDDWYCEPCKAIISRVLKERHLRENRIGRDFQVDVPQWSGANSIYQEDDEPLEMVPTNFNGPNELNFKKANSLGNWIQCQGEIGNDENGQVIICGKWRRAPLFVEQHEEWDCSCAIFWDPLHADCVVPQELPTSEVKKQLGFMNKVNELLAEGQLEAAEETWHLGDHQGND